MLTQVKKLTEGIKRRIDHANRELATDDQIRSLEERFISNREKLLPSGTCKSAWEDAKCLDGAHFRIIELQRFGDRSEFFCKLQLESNVPRSSLIGSEIEIFGRVWGQNTQIVDVDGEVGDRVIAAFNPRGEEALKAIEYPRSPIWANHLILRLDRSQKDLEIHRALEELNTWSDLSFLDIK